MSDWSEYEREVPVRPAGRPRCLRGHDLSITGVTVGRSRALDLPTITCSACWALRVPMPTWAEIDPARHATINDAPSAGLVLVRVPPDRPAAVGRIELRLDGEAVADVDVTVCGPCKRAVLEQIRVDEGKRRNGFGRVLVAAAVSLVPKFRWLTTKIDRGDPVAVAFWASVEFPGSLGEPDYCTDMKRASGELGDW